MLVLAIGRALFSSKFERAQFLFRVNSVAVSQRPQSTGNGTFVLRVESVGMEITKWALVRDQSALRL